MPSQTAIQLMADRDAIQLQIDYLLSQTVLVATSLDGQSFDPMAALTAAYALKKEILILLRNELPYEYLTKTLPT